MGASRPSSSSSFSCEIRITEAKNMDLVQPTDTVFLRLYLSAGSTNQKIRLNTRELPSPSSSGLHWNESFSLECTGNEDSAKALRQESVVFELRARSKASILGPIGRRSRVVGRAEIPWKTVLESPGMEMETWVRMGSSSRGRVSEDVKPPSVRIAMRLRIADMVAVGRRERTREARLKKTGECGCDDCGLSLCSREDYDVFVALAASVEAF
ncbi:uncharacterized protein LOC115744110 [Rhodamnia argentea]|uniref:Uncharacterized protein LOC115744110 n=1 Tax=Rhodamnia argentea TaxID=178133 RepID=A0A8B8PK21_9MYRT|nr:uncharacterized protein LOC115744110 [Rhodamnia argentea]